MRLRNNFLFLFAFGVLFFSSSLSFASASTIIVDDQNIGYSDTGWTLATGQGYSSTVHWKYRNGNGYAAWVQNSPGIYDVFVSWTIDSNRPTDAKYTVYYDSGQYNFTINQTKNSIGGTFPSSEWPYWSGWKYIGKFNFASGNVTLWDSSNDGKVLIGDAVKFTSQACTLAYAMSLDNCYNGYYKTHWCSGSQLKSIQSCTSYCCSGTCSGGVCYTGPIPNATTTTTSTTTSTTTTTVPIATTTTTLPCTEMWLNSSQCVGGWVERQMQLTNCLVIWNFSEDCQYGCENGQCRTGLPTNALQMNYSDGTDLRFSNFKLYSIAYADNNVKITNIGSSVPIFLYVCGENFPGIVSFIPQIGTISLGWQYLPVCDSLMPYNNSLRISYALGLNKGVRLNNPKIFYNLPWSQGTLHFEYDTV